MSGLINLIDAFKPTDHEPPKTLLSFFRWALSGSFPVLLLAGLISATAGTLEVVRALLLGVVIDAALETGPQVFFAENTLLLIAITVFFVVLMPIVFAVSAYANSVIVQPNVQPLVLTRLNRWTLGQSITFFEEDFAGRIAQKQMQTARALTDVANEVINVVFFALASIIGSILLLTTINVWIAVALGAWMICYLAMIRWFMPRIRAKSKARAGARTLVTGQIVDTVTNIKTVKLFANAKFEDSAATDAIRAFRLRALDFGQLAALFRLTLMTLAGILPVLLIGGTLVLWTNGNATPGDIAAAGTIAIRIAQMTGWVSFTLMSIYSNVGEVEDGMNTLAPSRRIEDGSDARTLSVDEGTVRFDDVSFAYGQRTGGVDGIKLRVSAGQKIGIVGASGAGKSTLVSLLLRLYDPEAGRILIDGQDIRGVTQESLRRQIGMVTQETAMFNRSARDNILYGRANAGEEALIDAAKRAEAHDFITGLQDHKGRTGYDAHLGERGVKLSGGQRQRIALARAILKDAPILVLDEATSALDSEVEALIQHALENVMEGKTVLAIAHRLSTIARMDRIVVMDGGRIVEEGTHDALLALGGVYARFWDRQSGGFICLDDVAAE
jgi:ATP-binding cassette subfamily B protein